MSIIIASFLLLIILSYPSAKNIPIITPAKKNQLSRMNNGYLFTVAVDNRDHYIAQKTSKNNYELLYVNQHTKLKICQMVHTTGLDQQFPEDILVGYILNIENNPDNIYQTVNIGYSSQCNHEAVIF